MSIESEITALTADRTAIQNAISAKGGTVSSSDGFDDFAACIATIPSGSGGGITPSGNIQLTQSTSTDVTNYATATVRSASVSLNTPSINTSTGVVTSSANVSTTGWISSAPSSKTLSLATQGAQTITPTTSNQTISSGKYLTGTQTIVGDANLIASNIKSGVTIFGVTGTYTGSGGGSSTTYSVTPNTITWQHNTWVTLEMTISADGGLSIRKSSGGGTANNLRILYPQSDTYNASNIITAIPSIPQAAGTYELAVSIWWDGTTSNSDHNNHTITYEVVEN